MGPGVWCEGRISEYLRKGLQISCDYRLAELNGELLSSDAIFVWSINLTIDILLRGMLSGKCVVLALLHSFYTLHNGKL